MALSVSYSVHKRAETALFDRLQGLIYGILGATELGADATLRVSEAELPDGRLNLTTSGLYAELVSQSGQRIWQSMSTTELIPDVTDAATGDWTFELVQGSTGHSYHRLQLATLWEQSDGAELPFFVQVVADADVLTGQLLRFDRTLWASLLASAVGLLLIQLWILSRSLRPLTDIGEELGAIERGELESLSEAVPAELKPLASSINTLLKTERQRHQQHRHLLDDLAHSLKTPLSVLKNLGNNEVIASQTKQMQNTVEHYLQRASATTPAQLSPPLSPLPVIERLCAALTKIYYKPGVKFSTNVDLSFKVRLADADLYEIVGNVLENACKYGASSVAISSNAGRNLVIDDNGPGFPPALLSQLTNRGVRADTRVAGQGLGLAASLELMQSYGGKLTLGRSDSGGARVTLTFA